MNRSLLKSPTPWIATGMGLVIGLVCVLLKGDERMSQWLFTSYEAQGFPSLEKVPVASPISLIVMIVSTLGVVFAIEGTPGNLRRVMLLVTSLLVLVMASPVWALWGVFWSPMVNFISILWAGIAAMVHASSLDRVEAHHRAEAEKRVVTMRPPRSPSNS